MEETQNSRDDREYDRDYDYGGHEDNNGWDYLCDRLTLGRLEAEREHVDVMATPTDNGRYRTKIKWTADTGAPKTMLSEKHFGRILGKNPEMKIRRSNVKFRPYSTGKVVPLIGECEMKLTNEENYTIQTTVYIVEGEHESLLGRDDAKSLGII